MTYSKEKYDKDLAEVQNLLSERVTSGTLSGENLARVAHAIKAIADGRLENSNGYTARSVTLEPPTTVTDEPKPEESNEPTIDISKAALGLLNIIDALKKDKV